jgi:putative transposase
MATTFTSILLHVVFSTKNRAHLIASDIEPRLHAYIGGIGTRLGSPPVCLGGTSNHVHMLASLSKKVTLVEFVEAVKKDSSKWMKTQGACFSSFYWQEGYGAFSIGQSGVEALRAYIVNQKQHHRETTFEQEFLALLHMAMMQIDP